MTFWFSIISILSISIVPLCDISSSATRVTWYSRLLTAAQIFVRSLLRLSFLSFSFFSSPLSLTDVRVSLPSVNRSRIQARTVHMCRRRVELSLAARLPSADSTMYAQRDLGFRSRWQVNGLHGECDSSHRENGTELRLASRRAASHRTKHFRVYRRVYPRFSLSRVAISRPLSVSTQTALVDCSHSRNSRLSSTRRFASRIRATVPAG